MSAACGNEFVDVFSRIQIKRAELINVTSHVLAIYLQLLVKQRKYVMSAYKYIFLRQHFETTSGWDFLAGLQKIVLTTWQLN